MKNFSVLFFLECGAHLFSIRTVRGQDPKCWDDRKYKYEGQGKACFKFVAKDPASRCGLLDGNHSLSLRCPSSCKTCADCRDVEGKLFTGSGLSKPCSWAGKKAKKRCRLKIADRVEDKVVMSKYRIANYCPESCGLCPAPRCVDQKVTAQKLDASGAIVDDRMQWSSFGICTAISGDTMVVGAHTTDVLRGTAYVYRNDGFQKQWVLEAKLLPSDDPDSGERFGVAVALDGDVLVVGALNDDMKGSAYIFRRVRCGVWKEVQKVTAYDERRNSVYFGTHVGILAGGVIAVGSWLAPNDKSALYFYEPERTDWRKKGKWIDGPKVVLEENGEYCGKEISSYSGDRLATSGMHEGEGVVHIFFGSAIEQKIVVPHNDPRSCVHFGAGPMVSMSEDTLAIGSYLEDTVAGEGAGCVLIFTQENRGATWKETQKICAEDGSAGARFGAGVVVAGNVLAIGAKGITYIYSRRKKGGEWTLDRKVSAGTDQSGASRSSLSVFGKVLAIGANSEDKFMGAVYMTESGC